MATETTDILSLPYIMPSQAQKHVTHNEAIAALDALVQAVVADEAPAPPDTAEPGDRLIVAPDPTGAFAGQANAIAVYRDGGWAFLAPRSGWRVYDQARQRVVVFTGSGWEELPPPRTLTDLQTIGINASADTGNRLAVASPASLFDHEGGDHRLKVNKAADTDTASLLFQDGYSGRAEMGLAGSDDFAVKVSADGATWLEAMRIDRIGGKPSFPQGIAGFRQPLTADRTYYVDPAAGSDSNDGLTSGTAFATPQKAVTVAFSTLDLNGHNVTIQLADGTYAGTVTQTSPQVGAGTIKLRGNTPTPGNVLFSLAAQTAITIDGYGTKLAVEGIRLAFSGNGIGLTVTNGAYLTVAGNMDFGPALWHTRVDGLSTLRFAADYTISGGAQRHYFVGGNAKIDTAFRTLTLTGTPNFSNAFAYAEVGGVLLNIAMIFNGAATGKRYSGNRNAVIYTSAAEDYYPGSVAGSVVTGAQYG